MLFGRQAGEQTRRLAWTVPPGRGEGTAAYYTRHERVTQNSRRRGGRSLRCYAGSGQASGCFGGGIVQRGGGGRPFGRNRGGQEQRLREVAEQAEREDGENDYLRDLLFIELLHPRLLGRGGWGRPPNYIS